MILYVHVVFMEASMINLDRVSREVIDTIISITSEILGENGVKILVRDCDTDHKISGKELIYKIAEQLQNIYGYNGGYAVFREIGRQIAKKLMSQYPESEWSMIMEIGLNTMGFAEGIKRMSDSACICNCVFYPSFLQPEGIEPIHHTVCWGGLGFIEAFARKLEPDVVSVRWKERDYENKRCIFEYVRGEDGEG